MIDPRDFLATVQTAPNSRGARLATIDPDYASGVPRVTFDGDSTLSAGGFPFIESYDPSPEDRVVMLPVGNSYVILGSVIAS